MWQGTRTKMLVWPCQCVLELDILVLPCQCNRVLVWPGNQNVRVALSAWPGTKHLSVAGLRVAGEPEPGC